MKSDFQQKIITTLKEYRLKKGYTQQEIGALLGISNGQVGNIESPKMPHKYTLSQISMLCDEFQIEIENVFLDDLELMNNDNATKSLIKKIIEYED
jgi:transcriptional regulator with XRE-family HTH domain